MYLHLGQDTIVTTDEIVGIFDLDTSTVSKITREYLRQGEQRGQVITIGYDLPKSFVLCRGKKEGEQRIYISPIAVSTLLKRIEKL
ncbi:MAG: DUF370 domain-containing protein [Clostridiales bacterium]|nr:DUF370 domain-containing protein [Clostridiales bacterium]